MGGAIEESRGTGRVAPTLLERETELAVLTEALAAARAGEGRLVVIEGSAGMGKSRLLAETRRLAIAHEMHVLRSRAGEHEREFAFGVVRQLFEPLLVGSSAEQRAELLSGAASLVEPLFSVAVSPVSAAQEDSSFGIRHGLYWLAANLAYANPTCLVVDDLHWADGPSLHWLGYLARRLDGLPLVVVAAMRALPSRVTIRRCSTSCSPTRPLCWSGRHRSRSRRSQPSPGRARNRAGGGLLRGRGGRHRG